MKEYKLGDHVVYRKQKSSTHPGPRAQQVQPARAGEDYRYVVDKYWTVTRKIGEDEIEVRTRTGKTHRLHIDDPRLRRAGILDRLLYHSRFAALESGNSATLQT